MKESVCGLCNDTGWVMVLQEEREIARKCECTIKKSTDQRMNHANIPMRFQGTSLFATIDGYKTNEDNPSQGVAKIKAQKFIKDYPALDKGLLFQGRTGLGKTTYLCGIGCDLIKKGVDVFYMDWNDLVREMRTGEGHATRDFSTIHFLVSRLAEVELLLFDELGASKVSTWVDDNIYYLFNRRYNDNKLTICATNYLDKPIDAQESLSQRIGERIRSRLYEMTEAIEIKGNDFRRNQLGGR